MDDALSRHLQLHVDDVEAVPADEYLAFDSIEVVAPPGSACAVDVAVAAGGLVDACRHHEVDCAGSIGRVGIDGGCRVFQFHAGSSIGIDGVFGIDEVYGDTAEVYVLVVTASTQDCQGNGYVEESSHVGCQVRFAVSVPDRSSRRGCSCC